MIRSTLGTAVFLLVLPSLAFAQNSSRTVERIEQKGNRLEVVTNDGVYRITPYSDRIMETVFVPKGEAHEGRSHAVVMTPRSTGSLTTKDGAAVFATAGISATPHSQRSTAQLSLQLDDTLDDLPLIAAINAAEAALGTAVQTAVKRADEQAFALANGQNLMFCEDAARRLHLALTRFPALCGFALRVVHAESLHAHDAVAESRWTRQAA